MIEFRPTNSSRLNDAIEAAAEKVDEEKNDDSPTLKPPVDTDGDLGKFVVANLHSVPLEILRDHMRERLLKPGDGTTEIEFAVGKTES